MWTSFGGVAVDPFRCCPLGLQTFALASALGGAGALDDQPSVFAFSTVSMEGLSVHFGGWGRNGFSSLKNILKCSR